MNQHALYAAETEGGKTTRRVHTRVVTAQDFPYSGNVPLVLVLTFVGLAKSTAYKLGIVPIYDDDGQLIDTGKVPPFPWTRMPHSLIRSRNGKKLFDAAEIRAWLEAVRDRSRLVDGIATHHHSNALVGREGN